MKAYGLLLLAMLSCPCHLPMLLALLGGTALGTLLLANIVPVVTALSIVFVATLLFALRAFGTDASPTCARDDVSRIQ